MNECNHEFVPSLIHIGVDKFDLKLTLSVCEKCYLSKYDIGLLEQLAASELARKEVLSQIESMKCCGNCKYEVHGYEFDYCDEDCNENDKWELRDKKDGVE